MSDLIRKHSLKGIASIYQLKRLELEESHIHSSAYYYMILMSFFVVQSLSFSICEINTALLLHDIYLGYVVFPMITLDSQKTRQANKQTKINHAQCANNSGYFFFFSQIVSLSFSGKSPINFVLLPFWRGYRWIGEVTQVGTNVLTYQLNRRETPRLWLI